MKIEESYHNHREKGAILSYLKFHCDDDRIITSLIIDSINDDIKLNMRK